MAKIHRSRGEHKCPGSNKHFRTKRGTLPRRYGKLGVRHAAMKLPALALETDYVHALILW